MTWYQIFMIAYIAGDIALGLVKVTNQVNRKQIAIGTAVLCSILSWGFYALFALVLRAGGFWQ